MAAPDSETGLTVPLFNPRTQRWSDHFAWSADRRVVGLTAVGRATVDALDLNRPRRVMIREAEEWFDLFPPDDPT